MLTEIYQRISAHKSFDHTKEIAKHQTLRLMEIHPNSLEKVVYLDTLLVQHKKLNRWLQPDGHTDGNGNLFEVALHETSEGTGLVLFIFMPVTNLIFDIDVQKIPERVAYLTHTNYDIRYIFQIPEINLAGNKGSYEIQFVPINEVKQINNTASVRRMLLKPNVNFRILEQSRAHRKTEWR